MDILRLLKKLLFAMDMVDYKLWRDRKGDNVNQWKEAQIWESNWWNGCGNTLGEEIKQLMYAERMGLEFVPDESTPYRIEMNGKSVLDVGGGPVSLLLKCVNVRGKVVDPLEYPAWVRERYKLAGIEYEQKKGEEIKENQIYDECWIYNCLQHVDSPEKIVKIIRRISKIIRVFEWIDLPKCEGHLHTLKAVELNQWFGGQGAVERIKGERDCWGKCYYGIFKGEKYEEQKV